MKKVEALLEYLKKHGIIYDFVVGGNRVGIHKDKDVIEYLFIDIKEDENEPI